MPTYDEYTAAGGTLTEVDGVQWQADGVATLTPGE